MNNSITHFQLTQTTKTVHEISPKETYIFTLGFFLTTPENRSALNLHEEAFYGLLRSADPHESLKLLQNEILIVERLLMSTYNRLNKSSSLWCNYRKLLILSRKLGLGLLKFESTFILSASRHFSNYYCWNTMRWFFDVAPLADKRNLLEATQSFCFRNLKDSSSWSALAYMVCQKKLMNCFNFEDYKRLIRHLRLEHDQIEFEAWLQLDVASVLTKIIKKIDTAYVSEWPPFQCLFTIYHHFPETAAPLIPENWIKDIDAFQKEHSAICLLRNNPLIPEAQADDLLLSSNIRHLGFKKLFMQKTDQVKLT